MDRATFQDWLDRYIDAWRANEPEPIAALFTEDARYGYHPSDEPVTGRDAIVASWLEEPDDPGDWEAQYDAWAVDGDRGVGYGWTKYFEHGAPHDGPTESEWFNAFFVEFAEDGRARSFLEIDVQSREGLRQRFEQRAADAVAEARTQWEQDAANADGARALDETKVRG